MSERNEDWLQRLLAEGESEQLEFKENIGREAIETVAAFANAQGGTLLIGVADDGTVKGVTLGKETLRDWSNRIAQATRIHPQFQRLTYQDKDIVVIEIPESPVKPVPCRGRYFKRVGSGNRQMTEDDLTRAVLGSAGTTWDEGIESRATLEDLDAEQIQRFRKRCNQKGRRPIPADDDTLTVLDKLKLLEGGQPTRAAVLLFGTSPQHFYPQARIRIGRFRTPTLIVDDREIAGSLFDQAEALMHYFRERLQTRYVFEGAPTRDVVWEYPLEALREAIINAICHRDYMDHGHVQVRWYDDRIVFVNPGGLPAALHIEDLKREHRSVLRNRKIAAMLFYAGFIEQWGSGTLRMIQACVTAGLPEPEFEERQEALWVTFRKHELDEGRLRAEGFNERQVKAALFAQAQGRITSRDYRQLNQVSPKTAYLELAELVGRGWLIREGGGSMSSYILAR